MKQKGTQGTPESPVSHLRWRTSSYSGNGGGQCVEVGAFAGMSLVRDSRNPDGPVLLFKSETWRATLDEIKRGALDLH
ncbi:DUF397 domain-containing protein [Actinomadura meridiana]|uniref:DUF397 domain-containing protein n=1 Tax=Actinomadura meridiana TaxID=559626 RepID=A0ABP8C2N4_9ACTN